MRIVLTFDVDFMDYLDGSTVNEFKLAFPSITDILSKFREIKSTWFVRIDSQIECMFNSPEYFFENYRAEIESLISNGHEIGWHHHATELKDGVWTQKTDVRSVCEDLVHYGKIALKHGIRTCRMGAGFHTNETIKTVDELGFEIDSSAIPRPKYRWETTIKDWSTTGQNPYHPSLNDYRTSGELHLNLLELPLTTTLVSAGYDKEEIIRYVNPTYMKDIFRNAVNVISGHEFLVLICHPYEIISKRRPNGLLSFNHETFCDNLKFLLDKSDNFDTISDVNIFFRGSNNEKTGFQK